MDYKVEGRVVEVAVEGLDTLVTTVDGVKNTVVINDYLKVEEEDLGLVQRQLAENPAQYAYYASVLSWYQYREEQLRYAMEQRVAERDLTLRADPRHGSAKEREFKSLMETTDTVIAAREELAKIGYVVKKLALFVRAIEKKGDRIVQIYSRLKNEEAQHKF